MTLPPTPQVSEQVKEVLNKLPDIKGLNEQEVRNLATVIAALPASGGGCLGGCGSPK